MHVESGDAFGLPPVPAHEPARRFKEEVVAQEVGAALHAAVTHYG